MKALIKLCILFFFIGKVQTGLCNDSTYIMFTWGGEVDKPYYEFLFYKTGSVYPDQGRNLFVFICQLTDDQFFGLKSILIDDFAKTDKKDSYGGWWKNYYVGDFNGENLVSYTKISTLDDLILISTLMKNYFKETQYSDKINSHWKGLFERFGF